MPQIVNSKCAVCDQRIESDLEGDYCPDCGGPVHHNCRRRTAPTPERCGTCGGLLGHPIGVQNRKEKEIADRSAAAKLRKAKEAPKRKFGFPLYMVSGFSAGAFVSICLVISVAGFRYSAMMYGVMGLGSLGAYVGHEVGAWRYPEVGFKPGGPLTEQVAILLGAITMLGTLLAVGAVVGIMTLLIGPPPH